MSDHGWTHLMCDDCWYLEKGTQVPVAVKGDPRAPCCFCLKPTNSGIWIRRNPNQTLCRGIGKKEDPVDQEICRVCEGKWDSPKQIPDVSKMSVDDPYMVENWTTCPANAHDEHPWDQLNYMVEIFQDSVTQAIDYQAEIAKLKGLIGSRDKVIEAQFNALDKLDTRIDRLELTLGVEH